MDYDYHYYCCLFDDGLMRNIQLLYYNLCQTVIAQIAVAVVVKMDYSMVVVVV